MGWILLIDLLLSETHEWEWIKMNLINAKQPTDYCTIFKKDSIKGVTKSPTGYRVRAVSFMKICPCYCSFSLDLETSHLRRINMVKVFRGKNLSIVTLPFKRTNLPLVPLANSLLTIKSQPQHARCNQ
jgi:hypothetical protein